MKKLFGFIGAIVIGANAYALDYTIKSSLPDHEGEVFVVVDRDQNKKIASGTVKDGELVISGTYPRDAVVEIRKEDDGNVYAFCILENEVVVDFDNHKAKPGAPLNDKMINILAAQDRYFNSIDSIRAANKDNGAEVRDSVLQAFIRVNYPELKKKFIRGMIENQDGFGEQLVFSESRILTPDEWDEVYAAMTPRLKDLKVTENFNDIFKAQRETAVGKHFVDLAGKSVDGELVQLSDYVGKGKYVLVDFWASWCMPCRMEAQRTLKPLYEKYGNDERFEIVGVATWENADRTLKALPELGYKWTQIIGAGETPMQKYGFDGIPMIILIGPDGTILERNIRGNAIVEAVEKYLGKK
ncbi:MAG: TlpA family protein disulfide reductase [Paramuribaculum sp.]|nr:TlpA family protein disulfide reductase [Paramuribaculum sp.]